MPSEYILRLPRSDDEPSFVLLHITSNGPSPLDLKLLATEGESPYIVNLKQSRVQTYRAKASQLDDTQWEALLLSILLRHPLSEKATGVEALEKLETTASITKEKLIITFRKNISGITQRLGEIPLEKDEEQEIDSVSWAGTAAARSADLEKEVEALKGKYQDQSKMMEKLNQQLQDLIKAKLQHENELLEKFRELLNAKKLKIRDLHRVLAGTKIDPQKASQPRSARESSMTRTPAASRTAKRKAKGDPSADAASASSTDDEATSDKMSVDEEHRRPQINTPERSEPSATEDETDDLDSAPIAQPIKSALSKPSTVASPAKKPARALTPPPRRELPFPSHRQRAVDKTSAKTQSPAGHQATKSQAVVEADDDDNASSETSDDEL